MDHWPAEFNAILTWIELILKLPPHSCKRKGNRSLLHLLLLTVILNPKSSPENNRKDKKPSLRFSLGNNERHYWSETKTESKPQKTKPPAAFARGRPDYDLPQWRLVSILSNLNGVPGFGTIKRRENEAIPIWNLIVALAENSRGQWSGFSWTPSVRSRWQWGGETNPIASLEFPPLPRPRTKKHNSPLWVRALSSFIELFELFLGIINTWKTPEFAHPGFFV